MNNLIDRIYLLWKNGSNIESKLVTYQGYKRNSLIDWKKQTGLPWSIVLKLIKNFEIYSAQKIRLTIRHIVANNEALFSQKNCFITGFGNAGKSGDIILYEFSHTSGINQSKVKKTWELHNLPEKSTIIFVEDLIGTGTQSVDYIQNKVNQILKPSHDPYLLSLCATPAGLKRVTENTHFKVLPGIILAEEFQHYSDESKVFTKKEKLRILEANQLLKVEGRDDFDLGLLLAFYFTIPNNVMPIFWKDKFQYVSKNGQVRQWMGLLPRYF